jgi:hypothetical protein
VIRRLGLTGSEVVSGAGRCRVGAVIAPPPS